MFFFGTINQTNFKMIYSDATFFLGDNFGLVKFFFLFGSHKCLLEKNCKTALPAERQFA